MPAQTTYRAFRFFSQVLFYLFLPFALLSQDNIGVYGHYGFIFVHSDNVENTRNSRPFGFQADLIQLRYDSTNYNACRCYPKTGFSFYYFNYDNPILGHNLSAAYFLEPAFRISGDHLLVFRGTVGLSYLTNPHHPVNNPDNFSYSTSLSALLGLGAGFDIRVHPQWRFNLMANFLHISNGGIKDPNKGINWPTLSAGMTYAPNPKLSVYRKNKGSYIDKEQRIDIFLPVSSRIAEIGDKARYWVFGAGALYSKQLSALNAITLGGEWHTDLALEEKQRRAGYSEAEHQFAGIGLGHEFILGRFLFSQQLFFYLLRPRVVSQDVYHRWGLTYRVNRHFQFGMNLKAHAQVAHFLDFRLVYSFVR